MVFCCFLHKRVWYRKYVDHVDTIFTQKKNPFLCILSGCDGWIRVWDLESICNAKAAETDSEKALFHLDPMNEIEVEAGAELKSIAKSKIEAEDNNDWFIQDASGSIWKVDLSFSLNMQKPSRIYR